MKRISEKLDCLFRCVVLGLFGLFLIYLTLLSLFSTNYCFVGSPGYFVSDSPGKALVCYILLILLLWALRKRGLKGRLEKHQKKIRIAGNVLLAGFLLYFVLGTQLAPHGDQLAICNAAAGLDVYDFSLFTKGNYFDYWPFQSRIVVFLWGLFQIVGNSNYLAIQILNVLGIVVSVNMITETFCLAADGFYGYADGASGDTSRPYDFAAAGDKRDRRGAGWGGCCGSTDGCRKNMVFFGCCLFLPFLLYVTYIYGNIIGFAFMTAALYALTRWLKGHRIRDLTALVICCAVGVWLKNTYMIFMVAILVFLLADFWQRWSYVSILGILCVAGAVSLLGKGSDMLLERRLGFPLSDGSPMLAWVTMAFGEEEDGDPVKFDNYNIDVYLDNDMDTAKALEAAEEELKSRLTALTDTPEHFISFMGKKIALEWNEPTFESLVANNRAYPQVEEPAFIRNMLRQDNRSWFVRYADLFHALVLMGALSWVLLRGKRENLPALLFAVIFIGGFLFQLFWETLAQYTLMYFLLLIPYAVLGYLEAARRLDGFVCDIRRCRSSRRAAAGMAAVALALVIVWRSDSRTIHDLFKLDYDDVSYTQELAETLLEEEANSAALPDGHYLVSPASMEGYGVVSLGERSGDEETNRQTPVLLQRIDDENSGILELHHEYNYDLLRIQRTQLLLSLSADPAEGEADVGQDYDNAMWKIIEVPEKGYAITYGEAYALTAADGALKLEPFTGADNQVWLFERR